MLRGKFTAQKAGIEVLQINTNMAKTMWLNSWTKTVRKLLLIYSRYAKKRDSIDFLSLFVNITIIFPGGKVDFLFQHFDHNKRLD